MISKNQINNIKINKIYQKRALSQCFSSEPRNPETSKVCLIPCFRGFERITSKQNKITKIKQQ